MLAVELCVYVFAFIVKLEVKSESCQAHFGISHNSLDALHVSKIVPVESASGSIVCIPVSNLISKCVFVTIDDDLCKCQYVVSSEQATS